jgi:hypothetical protein
VTKALPPSQRVYAPRETWVCTDTRYITRGISNKAFRGKPDDTPLEPRMDRKSLVTRRCNPTRHTTAAGYRSRYFPAGTLPCNANQPQPIPGARLQGPLAGPRLKPVVKPRKCSPESQKPCPSRKQRVVENHHRSLIFLFELSLRGHIAILIKEINPKAAV